MRNTRRARPLSTTMAIAMVGLLLTASSPATAALSSRLAGTSRNAVAYRALRIDPCETDPAITCDSTARGVHVPHLVYVPVHAVSQPRLAVFFPGTGARPSYYTPVAEALARQGWFVIDLRYATSVATENACPNAAAQTDPECYRRFRSESVFGENVPDPAGHAYNYAGTHIDKANSVMNRLLKLVGYLSAHPAVAGPGWGQFLATRNGACSSFNVTYGACNLNWARIALGGHSQGAGVALYLAKFYSVARVAMLSGPEDAYLLPTRTLPASWISEGKFATPAGRMYGFTHTGDPFYRRQTAVWAALGLPGALTKYASGMALLSSHRLVTSIGPACVRLGAALAAHSATSVIGCVDLPAYAAIWSAMFGPAS